MDESLRGRLNYLEFLAQKKKIAVGAHVALLSIVLYVHLVHFSFPPVRGDMYSDCRLFFL